MNKLGMAVRLGQCEGVMLALYGICRDLAIGCSVDEDKDGKLGACVADAMGKFDEVYTELGIDLDDTDTSEQENIRLPGWMRRAAKTDAPTTDDDEGDRP